MLDPIQILLTVVITTLTVLLVIIGIEVFQILKEVKKMMEKFNKIVDDAHTISHSVATPVEEASSFIMGLKKGVNFFKVVSRLFEKEDEKEKNE